MPGLVEFFATLRRLDIGFVLATNNATKTASQYTGKLARFNLHIPEEQIVTSAEATASYLGGKYEPGTAAYVVGDNGLHQAMAAREFRIITPDQAKAGATAEVVVLGFNQNVNYWQLAMGALLVHKGATFVGTNPDPSFPSELGPLPGAGSLLAVISTATGVTPEIIGKPGPILFQEAVRRLGGKQADTVMVGDRLSTDIAGGHAAGLRTALVLSGISTLADINGSGPAPDYIFEDIRELAKHLENMD